MKSGDELKKTYAKVDHELANAWYKTADEAKKSGKDASQLLKKAGEELEDAAKWSGTQLGKRVCGRLSKPSKSSVKARRKVSRQVPKKSIGC